MDRAISSNFYGAFVDNGRGIRCFRKFMINLSITVGVKMVDIRVGVTVGVGKIFGADGQIPRGRSLGDRIRVSCLL